MEQRLTEMSQQALYEQLIHLKKIGERMSLKISDELIIAESMIKLHKAILKEERLNKCENCDNKRKN